MTGFLKQIAGMAGRPQIEAWLEQSMVPVEPRAGFIARMRARLVDYRGDGRNSAWVAVSLVAVMVFVLAAGIGGLVRVVLAVLGLVGLLDRRRTPRQPSSTSP